MHVLDKVAGAAHFDLPRSTAQLLQTKLQELLPAYLVPRFVEEIPGQPSKIWLFSVEFETLNRQG